MLQKKSPTLQDKIRGSFIGAGIGDALGAPVEGMTREKILVATDGKGVTGYIKPIQTHIKDTMHLPPGSTTDDTQLLLAVARSLVRSHGFILYDQVKELVAEFETAKFGWGGTTKIAAQEFKTYFDTRGKSGRHHASRAPLPEKIGDACGTGVAMKVAPLAIYHAARFGLDTRMLEADVMALGFMTHGDPRASFAALAISAIITPAIFFFGTPHNETATMASWLTMSMVKDAEQRYQFIDTRDHSDTFSGRLLKSRENNTSAQTLLEHVGSSYSALEAVPLAIGIAFRHLFENGGNFRDAVLEAVNDGGDTDTTASMVGAMIGAHIGYSQIPQDLVSGLRMKTELQKTADDLYLQVK